MVKKVLGLWMMVLAMMLALGGAVAEEEWPPADSLLKNPDTFAKVDAERIDIEDLAGVKYSTFEKTDGKLVARISAADTDWQSAMIYGTYPNVTVRPYVTRPSDKYDTCVSFNGGFDVSIDSFFNMFANDLALNGIWDNNHTSHSNGEELGKIVAEQRMLVPRQGDTGGGGFCILWMDKDAYKYHYPDGHTFTSAELQQGHVSGDKIFNDIFYIEYVDLDIRIDTKETFYIPFRSLSAATLEPTRKYAVPDKVTLLDIENGDITYSYSGLTEDVDVTLAFKAPANATKLWLFSPIWENKTDENNYHAVSNSEVTWNYLIRSTIVVAEDLYNVVWLNDKDELVDYGVFWVHVETPGYLPGPCYVKNAEITLRNGTTKTVTWNAVPSTRVSIENNCKPLGVKTSYTESTGTYHISYNEVDEITGTIGKIYVKVQAPSGATYARFNQGGGNNIMGPDSGMAQEQHNIIAFQSYVMKQETVNGYITLFEHEPLEHYTAGPMDVYIQSEAVWPYGGGHSVIYWYASKAAAEANPEEPMAIEYVVNTSDTICVTTRTEIVESESSIPEKDRPVKHVTCVSKDHHGKNWHLVIQRHPQKGHNACHWELYVENECGDYEPLTGNTTFYMPYPEGHHYDYESDCARDSNGNKCTYEIYHYNADYQACDSVTATPTEYGIKFVTRSLSPFVLDWGNYQGSLVATPTPAPTEEPEPTPTEEPEPTPTPDHGEGGEDDEPTPGPEDTWQPGEGEGDEGNQGGNGGDHQEERYHLRELDLWRGRTNVSGGRFRDVSVTNKSTVTILGTKIVGLHMRFYEQGDGDGVTIGPKTAIQELVFEFGTELPDEIKAPFIVVEEGAAIGEIRIDFDRQCTSVSLTGTLVKFKDKSVPVQLVIMGDVALFNPNWIDGANIKAVRVETRSEDGENWNDPEVFDSYEAFLDALPNPN